MAPIARSASWPEASLEPAGRNVTQALLISQVLMILGAVLCGAVLAVQVGVNVQFRNAIGDPITSTFLSFAVGSVGVLLYALVVRAPWPAPATLAHIPAWQWSGGLLGALYVVGTILLGPRLGAAVLLALVIAGQMLCALLLDHYGWLGFAQHSINLGRVLGAALLVVGAVLVLRS